MTCTPQAFTQTLESQGMSATAFLASSTDLKAILSYHITPEVLPAPEDLVGAGSMKTLLPGAELTSRAECVPGAALPGSMQAIHAALPHAFCCACRAPAEQLHVLPCHMQRGASCASLCC